jgi:hypothetical protein
MNAGSNINSKLKKKKRNSSNYKAFLLPVAVVLLLIGLIVWNNIQKEIKLPSPDWSRSAAIPADSNSSEPFVSKKDNNYLVYTHQKNGITKTTLDEKLHVVDEESTKLPIEERSRFWAKGDQYAFITGSGELVLQNGDQQTAIDKNVQILAPAKDQFAYSKDNKVYVYDPKTSKSELIFIAKEKLSELSGHPESNSYIAVVGESVSMSAYFLHNENGSYKATDILDFSKTPTDKLYNFRFAEAKDTIHFIYTMYSSKQGTKSFKTYYGAAPTEKLNELSFNPISFIDESLHYEIQNGTFQQINVDGGKPSILFAATGPVSDKKDAGNIYYAVNKNGTWGANRISTTNNYSTYPLKADSQTVFWITATDLTHFKVHGASQNAHIIKDSQSIHNQDVMNASFDAFASTIVSFIAMTNAFVWIIPTILFLGILYIVKIDVIEDERPWVKWVSIALFILTQLYVIQSLFNTQFYMYAPNYLTFDGSSYVIPIIVSLISLGILQLAKNKDWGLFAQVSYFIGITVLFQLFIVGTYVY